MKKIFLTWGMACIAGAVFAQNLQFSKTEHRFPALRENEKETSCTFTFVNKSSNLVNITGVVCPQKNIRITWEKDSIGKKESGVITVIVNPKGSIGSFDCPIKISTLEKGQTEEYTLKVKGEVLEKEKSKQEIYSMKEGNLRYQTNHKTGYKFSPITEVVDTFFFFNEWEETMTLTRGMLPPAIEIVYLTPEIAPMGEGILVFRYKAEAKKDWGWIYDKFTLNTNDTLAPSKSLHISGDIYDDFASWTPAQLKNAPKVKMSEEDHPFGTVKAGENVEHNFIITNIGKSKMYIHKVKGSCSCTAVQPEKNELEPDESTTLKTIFRTNNKSGRQSPTIDVITNDPERPKVTLTLSGNVVKQDN